MFTNDRFYSFITSFFVLLCEKWPFFEKVNFFTELVGGGLISTDGVNFGIKSLVSASGTLHRMGAIKFKNEPITTPPSTMPEHL